jgi:hypothetical protein
MFRFSRKQIGLSANSWILETMGTDFRVLQFDMGDYMRIVVTKCMGFA